MQKVSIDITLVVVLTKYHVAVSDPFPSKPVDEVKAEVFIAPATESNGR